jgi:hypothetical protein
LSRFWGVPVYLGATVVLPKGYAEHPTLLSSGLCSRLSR